MLDLHSHVWGKDVVLQSEHLFLPKMKRVTTLMTAWAWGWHFLKPHNPVSPEKVCTFIWGEVISLSSVFIPALTRYQGLHLTLMSSRTWLFKQLLVKFCKSWGQHPSEANSGLFPLRKLYPDLTLRRTVSSCRGKATKAVVMKIQKALRQLWRNDFQSLSDQKNLASGAITIRLTSTSHSLMYSDGLLGLHFPLILTSSVAVLDVVAYDLHWPSCHIIRIRFIKYMPMPMSGWLKADLCLDLLFFTRVGAFITQGRHQKF